MEDSARYVTNIFRYVWGIGVFPSVVVADNLVILPKTRVLNTIAGIYASGVVPASKDKFIGPIIKNNVVVGGDATTETIIHGNYVGHNYNTMLMGNIVQRPIVKFGGSLVNGTDYTETRTFVISSAISGLTNPAVIQDINYFRMLKTLY